MSSDDQLMLFVKAGNDGKSYGACPFCQRIFMLLLIKANDHPMQFQVATVNLAKPPEIFKKLVLGRVPALVHGDVAMDDLDEIVQYLENTYPSDNLRYDNPEAEIECKDAFQKFCFYVKGASKNSQQMLAELSRINSHLQSTGQDFLCANHVTHLDCEVMPKLHHIRVASKALNQFEIPGSLKHLWRYMIKFYSEDVFTKSCPSDQEIIFHWGEKLPNDVRARMAKEMPSFSFDVNPTNT